MNLRNLEYFVELAESENYGQAAASLGISKSTLSHAIGKLEEEMGASLVDAGRSGCSLTPSGKALVMPARRLLESAANLPNAIKHASDVVSIGVPRRCNTEPLLRLLQDFESQTPFQCGFDIVQETYVNLKEALRVKKIEFAYCNKRIDTDFGDGFDTCVISDSPLYCIVGTNSPLAQREFLCPEDLEDYQIAVLDGVQAQHLRQYCNDSGRRLALSKPAMHRLSISLRIALNKCVAIDYQNWGCLYPDVIAVPLECTSEASASLRTQTTLFRLKSASEKSKSVKQTNSVAEALWDFANVWASRRQ